MLEYDPTRPLSPAARLLRIYLQDLAARPGWTIYVAQVQRALHLSEASWASLRRELEAQGYYRAVKLRTSEGKWVWHHHIYQSPVDRAAAKAIPPDFRDGGAMDGHGGDKSTSTERITTRCNSTARTRKVTTDAAPCSSKSKVKRVIHGIVCWDIDEVADAERIASSFKPSDIAAAVASLPAGKSFPRRVEAAIKHSLEQSKSSKHPSPRQSAVSLAERIDSRLERDLRYYAQMQRYGQLTAEEHDRERANAIAKYGSQHGEGSP